ncbi:MAG: hypothetical protein BWY65_01201 [Firmicutes bacterium ADurb.Bin373]|nr:MAG: hypothetical protein BWY65_01201 [Firmicutes bacterium ADurb.Bin373]
METGFQVIADVSGQQALCGFSDHRGDVSGMVGPGEIHAFLAFFSDIETGNGQVDLARLQGRDQGWKIHIGNNHFFPQSLADTCGQFHIKTTNLVTLINKFKGRHQGFSAHLQGFPGGRRVKFRHGRQSAVYKPAFFHIVQDTVALQIVYYLIHRFQQQRIAFFYGNSHIDKLYGRLQHGQVRVFSGNLLQSRALIDNGVDFVAPQCGRSVYNIIMIEYLRPGKPLPGCAVACRSGQNPNPLICQRAERHFSKILVTDMPFTASGQREDNGNNCPYDYHPSAQTASPLKGNACPVLIIEVQFSLLIMDILFYHRMGKIFFTYNGAGLASSQAVIPAQTGYFLCKTARIHCFFH